MKTKLVYVLTSNESDYYLEQVLLSAFSARMHNPDATILLVTDEQTNATITGKRALVKDYVSEILSVAVPENYSMMQRSRYIKTSLRNIVKGDFLYIDTDTIICDDLSDIDNFECSLGATTDGNKSLYVDYTQPKWSMLRTQCVLCNVPDTFNGAPFFNGGLIYAKDDDISRKLYSLWHSNWKRNVSMGVSRDQFPLLCANKEMGWVIQEIPPEYNCQITEQGLQYLYKAKIIHYYAMIQTNYLIGQRPFLEKIKEEGITDDTKEMIVNCAKGAFDESARIVLSDKMPIEETYYYQLYTSSKIGYKVISKLSKLTYELVVSGTKARRFLKNLFRKNQQENNKGII